MTNRASVIICLSFFSAIAAAQTPTIGNCTVFPADNIWNTPIDQLPVHPSSSTWVSTIGPASPLHPDFGSGNYDGGPIGIPYITVPGTQSKYPATFTYQSDSDPGPYAVPLNAPIEGGSASTGDRHVISIDVITASSTRFMTVIRRARVGKADPALFSICSLTRYGRLG